jgi:diphosphomevalonate decarboxylase
MSILTPFKKLNPTHYVTTWRSPSNIAFVKYWGKKGHQLPANPSLSMTLKECFTETSVTFSPAECLSVELYLDGKKEDKFAEKIQKYLFSLSDLTWLGKVSFQIHTKNTFPHGTGIASSASGLSAFALCLTDYLFFLSGEDCDFFQVAGHLSRLASGSACRSVYGGFTSWGSVSDYFATPFEVHSEMNHLRDSIIVINDKEKKISSTAGHGRMNDHAFANARFDQAKKNFDLMSSALKSGDTDQMGLLLESEALTLHAMMMTSPDAYFLLRPNTLLAIEMIWAFRRETKLPLYFTLDAGPNLHLIYPDDVGDKIRTFISHELSPFAVKVIEDQRGEGPQKC